MQRSRVLLIGVLAIGVVAGCVATYALISVYANSSFKAQINSVADALFIEQTEALRAIKGASIDKYQERLELTLRDQLTRLREVQKSGDVLSSQVQRELQFICQQVPEVVASARAVPHEGSGEICTSK